MIKTIAFIILSITTLITIIFLLIDIRKKRTITKHPFLSFIIPTYNDGKYLRDVINSIYDSYDKNNMEIFIINDNSNDNTKNILKLLQKEYKLNVIHNQINKGKSCSINSVFNKTKGDIVFMVDSDSILNKEGIDDILKRLNNKRVGGVSCRYKVKNRKGFLPIMQDVEYNMLAFVQSSYNIFSATALWGGCMAFKRKAFEDIGMLSENCITEDIDSALKLNECGWKVEQSNFPVYTQVPEKLSSWYKQKIRWSSGIMQCFINHYKIYLKNPLMLFFMFSYSLLALLFIISLINRYDIITSTYEIQNNIINLFKSWWDAFFNLSSILKKILFMFSYLIFSLPYLLYDKMYRKVSKLLLIIPFSLVYYPLFSIVSLIGFFIGIYRYPKLQKGGRAW